jgi:hypothetical protein
VTEWVRVSERLPLNAGPVLFFLTEYHWNRDDHYDIGEYQENERTGIGWWDGEFLIDPARVSHWMPLPVPPEV